MRLTQLAQELGRDPAEVLEILLRCPKPVFAQPMASDIYGIKIASHMVETAREYFLQSTAQEVIDHVKEHNPKNFKAQDLDLGWEEDD